MQVSLGAPAAARQAFTTAEAAEEVELSAAPLAQPVECLRPLKPALLLMSINMGAADSSPGRRISREPTKKTRHRYCAEVHRHQKDAQEMRKQPVV